MNAGGKREAVNVFGIDQLKELIELMEQHDLAEIDLQQDTDRISLKRGGAQPLQAMPAPMAAAPVAAATPAEPAGDGPNILTIKSPMVGTFYTKPNPESENFVKVGAMVSPDTVICIVEAMKVFNEIPAEVSGKVVAVLAENGQPVDFDKPLFKIDTSA
ncbi:Acetyl-CoA biotin carboxyl carrier [Roseimaritima multifibrata]|uniref:Biotin carboxyl carrier protein of acetyl-CoA carboxylase n=1 Tax=Roseimaritima multifibrata TaxID=1930274 RepID=A0A517MF56_9BACT|nr:acetyl-CoA carboxylase biotin carboxyl carrier protein [Roseimaritima multifibrata]QDS93518.1 Acetyl-CoA biotin carboxyl carrier [Roseimaritima multifibrata]